MIYLSKKKKQFSTNDRLCTLSTHTFYDTLYDQGIYILIGMIIGLHFFTPIYYMIMNQNFDMTDRLSTLYFTHICYMIMNLNFDKTEHLSTLHSTHICYLIMKLILIWLIICLHFILHTCVTWSWIWILICLNVCLHFILHTSVTWSWIWILIWLNICLHFIVHTSVAWSWI